MALHCLKSSTDCPVHIKKRLSSVQFSRKVMSDSLRPHGLQHAKPRCPSPAPRTYSNSCPLSRWSHPTISSSVIPFSSCLRSLPASESFPMSQLFAWDGQSTGVDCHFLLQGIFLTQGSNPGLPHCRQTLYRLSQQGSPINVLSKWLLLL